MKNKAGYRKDHLPQGSGLSIISQEKGARGEDKRRPTTDFVLYAIKVTRRYGITLSIIIIGLLFLTVCGSSELANIKQSFARSSFLSEHRQQAKIGSDQFFKDFRGIDGEFIDVVDVDLGVTQKYLDKNTRLLDLIGSGVDDDHLHGLYGFLANGDASWKPDTLDHKMSLEELKEAWKGYAFNTRLSDSLPLDRAVPDFAHYQCHSAKYDLESLPSASVVIVFHNENLSVLLRSFVSVLNRTPPSLLREIILVDDNSQDTHPWLQDELDRIIDTYPKVRIRRLHERAGLMLARMKGGEWARGDVVVFLDSHVEAMNRWLEPLLQIIQDDPKMIVVPAIGSIDNEDFTIVSGGIGGITFSWTLGQVHMSDTTGGVKPYPSPCMAGGLLATNKHWFLDILGGYDHEMRLYGGEEFEIGFKAWMCGGGILVAPCSKVAHVFRSDKYWKGQVYKVPGNEINRNKRRVAHVWMDEYKEIALNCIGPLQGLDLGSLADAERVRQTCNNGGPSKSFDWFVNNVATTVHVPELIEDTTGKRVALVGAFRNVLSNMCLDNMANDYGPYGLYGCHYEGSSQKWLVNWRDGIISSAASKFERLLGELDGKTFNADYKGSNSNRKKDGVYELSEVPDPPNQILKNAIHQQSANKALIWNMQFFQVKLRRSIVDGGAGMCLGVDSNTPEMVECDVTDAKQIWQIVGDDLHLELQ